MKTKLVEQRIGELLSDIDPTYDFNKHGWDAGGNINPEFIRTGKEVIITLQEGMNQGKRYTVQCYGDRHEVISVGMYDGWPFWKPTPSAFIKTWLGGEWHVFYSLSNPMEVEITPNDI